MADLGTLRPGAVNDTGLPTTGSLIGNPGGSTALSDDSDSTFDGQNTNSSGTYQKGRELGDTPSDLGNMDTLLVQFRRAWQSAPSNSTWDSLSARVMASNGTTVLAALNSGGAFKVTSTNITATSPTTATAVSFDYVNTSATKAQWDGAILQVQWVRTRNKGGDSLGMRVHEAYITGTYTVAVTNHPGTVATSGTGSLTANGVRTRFGQVVASGTGTLSPNGFKATTSTVTIPGVGSLSVPSTLRATYGSSAPAAVGSVTVLGFRTRFGQVASAGTGSLTASGTGESIKFGASQVSASGSLTSTAFKATFSTVTIPGVGSLAVPSTLRATFGQSAPSATGTVVVDGFKATFSTVAVAGTGTLTANGSGEGDKSGVVALSATGAVTSNGFKSTFSTVTSAGTGSLTSTAFKSTFGQSAPSATGALTVNGFSFSVLSGAIALTATGSLTANGSIPEAEAIVGVIALTATGSLVVVAFASPTPTISTTIRPRSRSSKPRPRSGSPTPRTSPPTPRPPAPLVLAAGAPSQPGSGRP